jgi:membrane-bound lytic murein transglycosylase D
VKSGALLICIVGSLLLVPSISPAQTDPDSFDSLVQSAEQWAKENLDDDALRALDQVDRDKVRRIFEDIQKQFQGEYVFDLGALQETAKAILPILEKYEETRPYALWLKSHMDYLEVAEQLRRASPPPQVKPGKPPSPPINPPATVEREIWVKKVGPSPWPPAARKYVRQLKPIFAAQNIPEELVWIAEVESSFDPRARSPQGAAGLYQLMPATAKRFGLRVYPFDQRLKPDQSAQAAAKYLHYLHRHYKDWRLALAAYNAGEGTVDKLLVKRKAKSFDAISTRLPAETQMFVPRVEAVILRREGLKLGGA